MYQCFTFIQDSRHCSTGFHIETPFEAQACKKIEQFIVKNYIKHCKNTFSYSLLYLKKPLKSKVIIEKYNIYNNWCIYIIIGVIGNIIIGE